MGISGSNLVFSWAWSSPELGTVEDGQLNQVVGLISGLSGLNMSSGMDKWMWIFDSAGMFDVASIKKILSAVNRVRPDRVFEWNNWVPKKVGIVAWRAEMERLPTRCALAARSIPVQNRTCVMCGNYDETSEHVFVSCQFAQLIWQNVALWCSIPPIIAFELKDLLSLHEVCSVSAKKRKALHAVILVVHFEVFGSRGMNLCFSKKNTKHDQHSG
ncbi:putative reverse transcriptase zinc-binding domain-containing protein [Helianthus annuus]|nr:putative reverse transcriptase zinc-binding domain-containing protein [Helianthus annuus]